MLNLARNSIPELHCSDSSVSNFTPDRGSCWVRKSPNIQKSVKFHVCGPAGVNGGCTDACEFFLKQRSFACKISLWSVTFLCVCMAAHKSATSARVGPWRPLLTVAVGHQRGSTAVREISSVTPQVTQIPADWFRYSMWAVGRSGLLDGPSCRSVSVGRKWRSVCLGLLTQAGDVYIHQVNGKVTGLVAKKLITLPGNWSNWMAFFMQLTVTDEFGLIRLPFTA